jgi:hypothetical protein
MCSEHLMGENPGRRCTKEGVPIQEKKNVWKTKTNGHSAFHSTVRLNASNKLANMSFYDHAPAGIQKHW